MSVKTTTGVLFSKPLQFIEETTEGATPGSGSTTVIGAITQFNIKIDGEFIDISQVGNEDLIAIVQGLNKYETQVKFAANTSTLQKRAFNIANYTTPTGTISATFSLIFAIYLNAVENWIVCKGTRAKQIQLSRETGKADEWTIDFIHTSIATPSASAPAGLTTSSTFASGAQWGHLDGGADPLSWNGTALKAKKVSITVNRNTEADYVLGSTDPYSTQPHARRISGEMTVLWTNTTLETDFKAGTARTLALVVKTSTSTITATNATITSYSRDNSADDNEAIVEQISWRCTAIAIT